MTRKEIGSTQLYLRLTPGHKEREREEKSSETATGMASYQKWTINIKMMKVGKGKSGSIETGENEFYSEHDASAAVAST